MVVVIVLCIGNVFAEKMTSNIQEAIYLFEMKGKSQEAIRILEKVTINGDQEDKESANFFLGKIHELADEKEQANNNYHQSLRNSRETNKAYWLAEREAATSNKAECLLKNKFTTKSPIKSIYYGPISYILLNNNTIQKIEKDSLVNVNVEIPAEASVLNITQHGVWFQFPTMDTLHFTPFHVSNPKLTFPIEKTTSIVTHNHEGLALSEKGLYLLAKKGIRAEIRDKYLNCKIEGFFTATNHYILNCPDNSLHFISSGDASETYTIRQYEPITSVLIIKNKVIITSGNTLYGYQPKASYSSPKWKIQFNNIDDVKIFEKNIAVLEASGKISLINIDNGFIESSVKSDASNIYPLSLGTLGLFSSEGSLNVVDTALHSLWHFNFANPITYSPIHTDNHTYLVFRNNHIQGISADYYGKQPLLAEKYVYKASALTEEKRWDLLRPVLDSLFKLEPGNAEGWFFLALLYENTNASESEKQKAWSEAVRLSISTPQITSLILNRYSKAIKAKFVNLLNVSPKTKYPRFFGVKKKLYTIDPAAEKLICLNADNGEFRWSKNLGKMDNSPVIGSDEDIIALASGFTLKLFDLEKNGFETKVQLPGKTFGLKIESNAIYVATWNGFLLKIQKNDGKLIWSRKIYAVPFLFAKNNQDIYLSSLDGEIIYISDDSGQVSVSGPRIQNNISQLTVSDSILAITTSSNKLYLFKRSDLNKEPIQILLESSITSMQSIRYNNENMLLIGLANQNILLYNESGAPLWKFQGKNSIFTQLFIHNDIAWIDQGNEVIGLSLSDGQIVKKFSTPGGAGPPFIMNETLFSASPKRLLYGFSL